MIVISNRFIAAFGLFLLMHANSSVCAESIRNVELLKSTYVVKEDENSPLAECEGKCDTDNDCDFGLVCFQRDKGTTDVPGCLGNADEVGEGSENFCIRPRQPHDTIVGDEDSFYDALLPLLVD